MANRVETVITAESKTAIKELKALKKEVNSLGSTVDNLGNKFKNSLSKASIFGAAQKTSILGWIGAIKNSTQAMIKATKSTSDYAESLNLLNVSYNKNTDSATALINKMSTMYGLDPSNLTKQLGVFKQMTNAMGMTNEQSALLSENLLKMQEDVSSLYNLDVEEVGRKFQSALAGQTRAVRSLGVDITKASLQQELYARGINKKYNELNRASKSALIYLAMERQLSKANGDAANTIDHLANQLRIFKEQLAVAARQIGAVFIPVVQAILPYLNGVLMALNEIGAALLGLIGVDINEMAKTSGISVIGTDIDDLGSGIDTASEKAKKLKNQLRGFDKLNVITTPTKDSGSGSGGVSGGGIDSALLKQLKEYDLKDVTMRANEIKEAFKEWLKVFKPLEEPLKNLANLTFDGLKYLWTDILQPIGKWANETLLPKVVETTASALDALYKSAKIIQPIVYGIMENVVKPFGRVLGKTVINILNLIKGAFDAISNSKLLQYLIGGSGLIIAFTKLIDLGKQACIWFGNTKLGKVITTNNSLLIESVKSAKSLKQGFKEYYDLVANGGEKTAKSIMGIKVNTDALQTAVSGAIQTALGISLIQTSLQDLKDGTFDLISAISLVAGAIEVAMGAVQLFTGVIGTLKTALTASNPFSLIVTSIVAVGGLIWALTAADSKMEETNAKFAELSEDEQKVITSHENHVFAIQNLSSELENLMDANGRVKQSDEDRVNYILNQVNEAYGTEYKLIDGLITRNGKVVKSYEEIEKEIDKYVNKTNAQFLLEKLKDKYNEALDKQYIHQQKINAANDEYKKQLDDLETKYKNGELSLEDYNKAVDALGIQHANTIKEIDNEYKSAKDFLEKYGDLSYSITTGNMDDINKYYNELMSITVDNSTNYGEEYAKKFETAIKNTLKGDYIDNIMGSKDELMNKGKKDSEAYFKGWNYTAGQKSISVSTKGNSVYFKQKADGGFLDTGEIFVAREAGPEMVGRIGNKTAVANNDQIVNSIAKGLAMSGIGKDTNVNIVAKGDASGLLDFITFEQQKRNRQYSL